jgi:copper chaperone CopZ
MGALRIYAQSQSQSQSEVILKVPNMSCKSCAIKINKALKKKHAIENVKVDVAAKTVRFDCPQNTCSLDKVISTLSDIGFKATPL